YVSNYDYLMQVNTLAGRSFNDLSQYPVMPWILSDYTSDTLDLNDPKVYRDLSLPMGALTTQRLNRFVDKFKTMEELGAEGGLGAELGMSPYFYGSHYSNLGAVLHFLVRLRPYTERFVAFQGGRFDLPDRTFHSLEHSWQLASELSGTDVKELIPEFFYLPDFLSNMNNYDLGVKQDGVRVGDVVLPPWAKGNPRYFILKHREALESPYVTERLPVWIDLIFGFKQMGKPAVQAYNVFHPMTYNGAVDVNAIQDPVQRSAVLTQIRSYGQTPQQLFNRPHPQRESLRILVRNNALINNLCIRVQLALPAIPCSPNELVPVSAWYLNPDTARPASKKADGRPEAKGAEARDAQSTPNSKPDPKPRDTPMKPVSSTSVDPHIEHRDDGKQNGEGVGDVGKDGDSVNAAQAEDNKRRDQKGHTTHHTTGRTGQRTSFSAAQAETEGTHSEKHARAGTGRDTDRTAGDVNTDLRTPSSLDGRGGVRQGRKRRYSLKRRKYTSCAERLYFTSEVVVVAVTCKSTALLPPEYTHAVTWDHTNGPNLVAYSPDRRACVSELLSDENRISCATASNVDSQSLFTGSVQGQVSIWRIRRMREKLKSEFREWLYFDLISAHSGHRGEVTCMSACDTFRFFATGGDDGRVCIWDIDRGVLSLVLHAHATPIGQCVTHLTTHLTSGAIVVVCRDNDYTAEVGTQEADGNDFERTVRGVYSTLCLYTVNGELVSKRRYTRNEFPNFGESSSSSHSNNLQWERERITARKEWRANPHSTARARAEPLEIVSLCMTQARISAGTDVVLVGDNRGVVCAYSLVDLTPVYRFKASHEGHPITNIETSPSGVSLVTADQSGCVVWWKNHAAPQDVQKPKLVTMPGLL
ncbi:hypothetical protein SARC_09057, partial [Sphaeroforma arctica JP610]